MSFRQTWDKCFNNSLNFQFSWRLCIYLRSYPMREVMLDYYLRMMLSLVFVSLSFKHKFVCTCVCMNSQFKRVCRHKYLALTVVRAICNPRSLVNVIAVGIHWFVSLSRSSFSLFTYVLLVAPIRCDTLLWDCWCNGGSLRQWWWGGAGSSLDSASLIPKLNVVDVQPRASLSLWTRETVREGET